MEGRLAHIQGYCRYVKEQPGRQMVQELQKLWKIHVEMLHDIRTKSDPEEGEDDIKYNKATDLKIGQLVLIKNNTGTVFDPKYIVNHRVICIINESVVILHIGLLVLIKNNTGTVFDPKYIVNHRVICIINESVVILQTLDGKEKRCNIHNLKPINTSQAFTLAFRDFQESVT